MRRSLLLRCPRLHRHRQRSRQRELDHRLRRNHHIRLFPHISRHSSSCARADQSYRSAHPRCHQPSPPISARTAGTPANHSRRPLTFAFLRLLILARADAHPANRHHFDPQCPFARLNLPCPLDAATVPITCVPRGYKTAPSASLIDEANTPLKPSPTLFLLALSCWEMDTLTAVPCWAHAKPAEEEVAAVQEPQQPQEAGPGAGALLLETSQPQAVPPQAPVHSSPAEIP